MISGECHVEGIPAPGSSSPGDRRLALDGLRLRLDLRIVPGASGGDAAAAAVWRIESDRLATLSLCAPSTVRRIAMAAGVAALALALGVWFLASPVTPTDARWASEHAPTAGASSPAGEAASASEAATRPGAGSALVSAPPPGDSAGPAPAGGSSDGSGTASTPASTAAPTRSALPASPAPEPPSIRADSQRSPPVDTTAPDSAPGAVAPRITVLPADTAPTTPASPAPADLRPSAPAAEPATVPSRQAASQRAARAPSGASPSAVASGVSRRAAPAVPNYDDMLDLFGDTK
jgi:hypothetical protein